MKLTYIWVGVIMAGLALPSCEKYIGQVPDDRLTLEETFLNRGTAEQFLANAYTMLPRENTQRFVGNRNSGPWTGASDEAEYLWPWCESNAINVGAWDPTHHLAETFWENYYKGIRTATIFLENADKIVNGLPADPAQANQIKARLKAEARALRAIFYFYLMRIYGPVVILGDEIIPVDAPADVIRRPRSSIDECVEFITSELDKAAPDLQVTYSNDDYARITRGIAKAFKAQALFYAASPLFNGNTDYADLKNKDGKQLIPQTYDPNKWKLAADAYKAFIDEFVPSKYDLYRKNDGNGNFSPFLSCRDVILDAWNKETILGRPDNDNARNYDVTPYHNGYAGEVKGAGGLGATQRIVDAFFMDNGRPIDDPASGYQETGFSQFQAPDDDQPREIYNQWINREPRFYVNITYNGRKWLNTNTGTVITLLYANANSGKYTSNDFCPTGYVVRKGAKLGHWNVGNSVIVLYRLANLYLDYVEALNEYDPTHPDILHYLNLVRERAGIPGYGQAGLDVPADQIAMREAIRRERQVELAFENVRYFDTRRWKIAEVTDNGPAIALNIEKGLPEFYEKVPFETRVFNKKHYLFPIPQKDISNNPLLVQNTGW